ncbi:MAG: hypothetical protein ABSG87_09640 [Verrucomicrobiota bacterium]|jgi:polyferredoxin
MKTTVKKLTIFLCGSSFQDDCFAPFNKLRCRKMNGQDEKPTPHRYKWPWFVLAAIILFVALAIVWMSFAVHREEQERDFNAPLPNNPAHQ